MELLDEVRSSCRAIAETSRFVSIHLEHARVPPEADPPALDPEAHYLEGSPEDVAAYMLTLDAVNFGSGWFPTLRKRAGRSGYFTVASALADRFRARGPWSNAELRALDARELAAVLDQEPGHPLMRLYAEALRDLGRFLGDRTALELVEEADGSAECLATILARGMRFFDDRGFYKRAQIVPSDLALAGHIDAERLLPPGRAEREIRACALHACEQLADRTGITPRVLDLRFWNRGQAPEYKAVPRHRTRTVYY